MQNHSHPVDHHLTYRSDIDGLRGLSVLIVILFHLNIQFVSGGFIGVDVFFVISGFFITRIITRDLNNNNFSFLTFYEKRIRRIIPTFFFITACVMLTAFLLLAPWELKSLGKSIKYALISCSNIYFNREANSYFGHDTEMMPMLHTWSLSIEEQFYIFMPFIMYILVKKTKNIHKRLRITFFTITLVSLALSIYEVSHNSTRCFYLLPYRTWELSLGACINFIPAKTFTKWQAHVLSIISAACILVPTFLFSHATTFPGHGALLPTVGAALFIYLGQNNKHFFSSILKCKIFVFLGLISYSLYLWHWPIIVFYKQRYGQTSIPPFDALAILLVTTILSILSWKFIEQPFRNKTQWPRKSIFIYSGICFIVLLSITSLAKHSHILEKRLPKKVLALLAFAHSDDKKITAEFLSNPDITTPYIYGEKSKPPTIALWGDSHANALVHHLQTLAQNNQKSFVFYGRAGTLPVENFTLKSLYNTQYTAQALENICKNPKIDTVIWCARWSVGSEGPTGLFGPAERGSNPYRKILYIKGKDLKQSSPEIRQEYKKLLQATLSKLIQHNKKIVLVSPFPEPAYKVPQTLAQEVIKGRRAEDFVIDANTTYFERNKFILKTFAEFSEHPEVTLIEPQSILITQSQIQLIKDNQVLYKDDDHLSLEGTELIVPLFDGIFNPSTQN